MNFEKYKNTLLYPKRPIKPILHSSPPNYFRNHTLDDFKSYKVAFEAWEKDKERYDELLKEWNIESRMLQRQFRYDAIREAGLADHPKAEMAFDMAWERGHSYGNHDVFSFLMDLADLLNASRFDCPLWNEGENNNNVY